MCKTLQMTADFRRSPSPLSLLTLLSSVQSSNIDTNIKAVQQSATGHCNPHVYTLYIVTTYFLHISFQHLCTLQHCTINKNMLHVLFLSVSCCCCQYCLHTSLPTVRFVGSAFFSAIQHSHLLL